MNKRGRPGIPYEQFVETWEQLAKDNRASINAVLDIIGGNKSTISAYRERYEREKSSKELALIKSVELPEAVHKAIAFIKVKELTAVELNNNQLKVRIDEYLDIIKKADEKLAMAKVEFDDAKTQFDIDKLTLERKLAAAQSRIEDLENREQKLNVRLEQLGEQFNAAKQEAAVAKKEVEMLREKPNT